MLEQAELGNFQISTRAQIEDQKKLSFSSSQERKRLFPESGKFVFVWIFISFGGSRDEDRFADVSVGDVGGILILLRVALIDKALAGLLRLLVLSNNVTLNRAVGTVRARIVNLSFLSLLNDQLMPTSSQVLQPKLNDSLWLATTTDVGH